MKALVSTVVLLATIAFVYALTGCGSSAKSAAPTVSSQPPAASVIADQRGCDDVTAIDPTLYAYDEVTATCTGLGQVDIATFKTDALRDKWIKIAEQFSTIEDSGHLYVIAS